MANIKGYKMVTTSILKTPIEEGCQTLAQGISTSERIMASTMSVDEYFDELINQVREDYSNL